MTDIPFTLNGARVVLRDWREADLAPFATWLRPGHRWKELDGPYYPLPSAGDVTAMVERDRAAIAAGDWPTPRTNLVIADKQSDALIGLVTWSWESEETYWPVVGIVLYDPATWGQGLGYEALGLWGDYLFAGLPQIARLDLRTWSGNIGMARLAAKLGYTLEARFRKARIVKGAYYDGLGYGVLREEWRERYPDGFAAYLNADPTPYPDVNAVLRLLLEGVRAILGADLVGLYLYGSLSSGDFDPVSSDIDFLVVTARELSGDTLAGLRAMHARIAASGLPWATKLEGSYIPQTALRRHDRANARHPSIGVDWDFGIGQHGSDWVIQRHIIREQGVVVWGPPPRTLIDPVTPDELRAAAIDTALDFWAAQTQGPQPKWLRPRAYQAFAILTMCRVLYTVERGEVVSKPVAAAWACAALGRRWSPLVERALTWRHDARPDDMTEMISFIQYTVDRLRQARHVL